MKISYNMSIFIDSHKAVLKQIGNIFLDSQSLLPNHQLSHFNPSEGDGFSELYDFGKICVGKGKYWLDHSIKMCAESSVHSFGITLLLSGTHHIKNHNNNIEYEIRSPMIILRKGNLGLQTIYLQKNKDMSLITIDFNKKLLKTLKSTLHENELTSFFLEPQITVMKTVNIPNKDILHQAHYLLNLAPAQSSIDLMHLEGAALELLSLILYKSEKTQSVPDHIQRAIFILENQFDTKITIRSLAKKVGINECDLKRLFKEHTKKTIGEYLLHIRMKHAQILLKEGLSIENVTSQIGYSSTQYFKQIFERHFGYHI